MLMFIDNASWGPCFGKINYLVAKWKASGKCSEYSSLTVSESRDSVKIYYACMCMWSLHEIGKSHNLYCKIIIRSQHDASLV